MVAKPVLNELDQRRFKALTQAFPEKVVLAQVPFSAFIRGCSLLNRLQMRKMRAEFLISHADFRPQAVVRFQSAMDGLMDTPTRVKLLERAGIKHVTLFGIATEPKSIDPMAMRGLLALTLQGRPSTSPSTAGR